MNKIEKNILCLLTIIALCSGCSSSTTTSSFKDGSYQTKAEGKNGDIVVTTVFENKEIKSVTIDEQSETEGVADTALQTIPEDIVKYQSISVDTVTGATVTSQAIIDAVTLAIENANGNPDDYKKEINKEATVVEDATCDVLVIGGGGAGMVSAIYAAQNGANVILVEKQASLGGNTALSRGVFGCSNSSFQKEAGINVTSEDHLNNYLSSYPNGDAKMLNILATKSGEAADCLMENGVSFEATQGNFTLVPEGHRLGSQLLEACKKLLNENKVDVRTSTKGTDLLVDENGGITGAKVETDGQTYIINAKAVIMTTGGFAANNEMVSQYYSLYNGLGFICAPSDEGDGHKMAEAIGAKLAYMDVMKANPFLYYDESSNNYTMIGTYVNPGIVVTTDGKRIGNEHANYYFSPAIMSQNEDVYLIYDESVRNSLEAPDVTTVSYNSLDELADAVGINKEELNNTIASYKEAKENGVDEFGRTIFQTTFDEGPYYAVKLTPAMQGTFGGILINENCEAINTDDTVINGLYAAGECAGDGLYGANPVPTDVVFGKIAGANAASYISK